MKTPKTRQTSSVFRESERERSYNYAPRKEGKEERKRTSGGTFESPQRDKRRSFERSHKRSSETDYQVGLRFEDITDNEVQLFQKLVECMNAAMGHLTRLKMLAYCVQPRSFSDIMLTLRLNPASLKFHKEILEKAGLIIKTNQGNLPYQTTPLGKGILRIIESVHEAFKEVISRT